MGNCITFRRVVAWMDDGEWDLLDSESPLHCTQSPTSQSEQQSIITKSTHEDVKLKHPAESLTAATKPTHEVRIKISKKQLAELLRQAESKGLPVQDVLLNLADTTKPRRVRHRNRIGQCWRPGLQSIPEIIE
ncbi:protein expression protein [Carex rostrata]